MELTAAEIQRRLPVWEALADLWLDTEVTDLEYRNIAARIIESGYTLAFVREIHDYELVPVVWANLLATAGEWAGFDEDWLREGCLRNARRRDACWHRFLCRCRLACFRQYNDNNWRAIGRWIAVPDTVPVKPVAARS